MFGSKVSFAHISVTNGSVSLKSKGLAEEDVPLMFRAVGAVLGYGVVGVWTAHAILDWSVRTVVFYLRYRGGKWTTKAIRS